MRFDDELARGRMLLSSCPTCRAAVWPPSDVCPRCLGDAEWGPFPESGRVVEFSRSGGEYFCLADFGGGVRLIGGLAGGREPRAGMRVRLAGAGARGGERHYDLAPQ